MLTSYPPAEFVETRVLLFRLGAHFSAQESLFPDQTGNPFHLKNLLTSYLDFIEITGDDLTRRPNLYSQCLTLDNHISTSACH